MNPDLDLLRGTLDVLVLKSLIFGARHGYDVAAWIFETSRETLRVDVPLASTSRPAAGRTTPTPSAHI